MVKSQAAVFYYPCLSSLYLLYYKLTMNFEIEFEQETDDRWIAEIPELPGVLAYGVTPLQAGARAKALALRVLAERNIRD